MLKLCLTNSLCLTFYKYPRSSIFKCFFIGGRCSDLRFVDVPTLAGRNEAYSHADLDVFLWLPGAPYLLPHFTSTLDSRKTYSSAFIMGEHDSALPPNLEKSSFTVIHYNQVCLSTHPSPRCASSHLIFTFY